jgi:hypothetical protein
MIALLEDPTKSVAGLATSDEIVVAVVSWKSMGAAQILREASATIPLERAWEEVAFQQDSWRATTFRQMRKEECHA